MSSSQPSTTQQTPQSYPPVTLFRRMLAILYDGLLLTALLFIAAGLALIINGGNAVDTDKLYIWLYRLFMFSLCFLYFCWFWVNGGQTLGMKTWHIRLSHSQGMSWTIATRHFFAALLSWVLAGSGFISALFHPHNKTLHDILSQCEMQDLR